MSEQENLLRHTLVKIAKEQCFKDPVITINPIESDGSNYTSVVFTATITAENKEKVNLFAKVASIGEKMREDSPMEIFKTESYFYKTLLKIYRKLEDEYGIPEKDRLRTPTFYGSDDEYLKEVLVLENMLANGFQVVDRINPMTGEFALQGVKQLAMYHGLSIALKVHYPQEFEETKQVLQSKEHDSLKKFLSSIFGTVIKSTEDNKKDTMTKLIKSVIDREDLSTVITFTKWPVLVHGDFRGSNLLYKTNKGDIEIAVLDFQTTSFGSPIFDLLYFLINGADKNFLEKWYYKALDKYYSELASALTKFKIHPEIFFSRENFNQELKRMLPINLVLGFCTLLIVTVNTDEAPKADFDLDIGKMGLVRPSDVYKERLNGILEFFIQEKILA